MRTRRDGENYKYLFSESKIKGNPEVCLQLTHIWLL